MKVEVIYDVLNSGTFFWEDKERKNLKNTVRKHGGALCGTQFVKSAESASLVTRARIARQERGATKCYTQKHKCQFRHSISDPVTILALLCEAPGQI
jgi:hypothetical protein